MTRIFDSIVIAWLAGLVGAAMLLRLALALLTS